jgi:hypothetical protein
VIAAHIADQPVEYYLHLIVSSYVLVLLVAAVLAQQSVSVYVFLKTLAMLNAHFPQHLEELLAD